MAALPWHLETLGLPPHADTVMVRRAYAAQLRRLDPGVDPEAFQRLREAYEAALAWCDEQPVTDDVIIMAPVKITADAGESEPPTPIPPAQDAAAQEAMQRLREGARRGHADAMATLLDDTLVSLRLGYIDAPGQFEDLLIDALRASSIPQRSALFDAAATAFHWHEVGRLRAGDPRAAWIACVLAQREIWHALDAGWRATWLELITRAHAGIDGYIARRWPDVGRLTELLPDWLMLHLTPAQISAWKAAFDALPPSTQDEFRQRAAPASAIVPIGARPPVRRRSLRLPPLAWTILWFVGMLVYLILNGIQTASREGKSEPLPNFNEAALTPRECVELYARFDRPDAFAGMPATDVVQAKRRAQRCALDGHWHAPSGTGESSNDH
ncbi:MAG TPA: hypothetical protein VGN46_12555 [Luteibacter sp.]|jgi:hypothetical protein|uniref:hypothetical protein n=1 Tax=Luteibacter sp. TaxID=1886636 RepID=UPI002F3E5A64